MIPEALKSILNELASLDDAAMRADYLIDLAEEFKPVPESIASRPYERDALVPGCESEAYAWAVRDSEGRLRLYFAVDNPQGISAKAIAVILQQGLAGAKRDEILAIPEEIVYQVFGRELSMGKGQGLKSMVGMSKALALRVLS